MRILTVSALFPPFVQGGAEISAHNLATWLVDQGHEVSVLTTAPTSADEVWDAVEGGCRIFRVSPPRAYSAFEASRAPGWKKPLWHLQDLFDPRNERMMDRILDVVQPDFVALHYIQGLGYNGLKAIGRRNIPAVFTLHDLGLACVKMAMFSDGKECAGHCAPCKATAKVKLGYLRHIERLGFISPSSANLEKLKTLQPIGDYPCYRALNANRYPVPRTVHEPADHIRILYVGRLHSSKGLDVALQALDKLGDRRFTLTILGNGPAEAEWRQSYGSRPWIRFGGHLPQQDVADQMAASDLLLVPSIWLENSPGVVIQALGVGLPVMGSDKGGIPELVQPGVNGMLVEAGNVVAWTEALAAVLDHPERLAPLRQNALASADAFAKPVLAGRIFSIFEAVRDGRQAEA